MTTMVRLQIKTVSGLDPQGDWHQEELIGGKFPIVN
jgi:hypothetical protein